MDYSLHDARLAGFTKIVFLIREEMHHVFDQQIGSKYRDKIEIEYACQSINDLPAVEIFSEDVARMGYWTCSLVCKGLH